MFVLHATKKLLGRIGRPDDAVAAPTTGLGNWYATALFWKPQVALFVIYAHRSNIGRIRRGGSDD